MNILYVGFQKDIEPPRSGTLIIDDEIWPLPRARIFEPGEHSFNPLKGIDHRRAREIADVLYTIYPQGENTLTVRNGRRALRGALERSKCLDELEFDSRISKEAREEAQGVIDDVLASPVLRDVLCSPTNFSFNPRSLITAKINRAELGEFDALVLGLFLMSHFRGDIVVPDFGFYGRAAHMRLLRKPGHLVAGVNTLAELPPIMRRSLNLFSERIPSTTTYDDAAELAKYDCRHPPNTEGYDTFIKYAMA